ncbi:MAG: hypothetical protein GY811_19325 [Myxococcales bacterium]|nr:hypothetical protein [Myxococcales bacterium]
MSSEAGRVVILCQHRWHKITTRLWTYALTLLVSAFLFFLVQPMMARFVLPYWGGGSSVWSVCLLFFQSTLLLGYIYAHLLARLLSYKLQALLHATLLLTSLALLPLTPPTYGPVTNTTLPSLHLLAQLTISVGLPCVLISASAPLLQHWFAKEHRSSPYRLYAISNVGSLVGLLTYPLVIEPALGLATQARLWSGGYLTLVALSVAAATLATKSIARAKLGAPNKDSPWSTRSLWLALSAAGVMLLMGSTTQITTSLVPMPLLWVGPLALYLLSFIWCFATDSPYNRRRWLTLFSLLILPTLWLPGLGGLLGPWISVTVLSFTMFCGCMICHGELARTKPDSQELSLYYVFLAAGGVLGSLFVNLAAPLLFERYWEFPIALFGTFALAGVCTVASVAIERGRPSRIGTGALVLWASGVTAFAFVGTLPLRAQRGTVAAHRSFYGTLGVVDTTSNGMPQRTLLHGRTRHGAQFLGDSSRRRATLYFSPDSGIGIALGHATSYSSPRHVGIIGLGVGTLASYGLAGDRFRFYELDPLVHHIAQRYFTFLADSLAAIKVVPGDGRLSLARELSSNGTNKFDILAVDAFNGDSPPTHLLTREAFSLYWEHLRPEGILALNVTNTFLDLSPVVHGLAQSMGKRALYLERAPSAQSRSGSTWILVTSNPALLEDARLRDELMPALPNTPPVWTDDYSNILGALK